MLFVINIKLFPHPEKEKFLGRCACLCVSERECECVRVCECMCEGVCMRVCLWARESVCEGVSSVKQAHARDSRTSLSAAERSGSEEREDWGNNCDNERWTGSAPEHFLTDGDTDDDHDDKKKNRINKLITANQ